MDGTPYDVHRVRKFIRAVGYFCHFIKNFAWIAKLLNDLLGCGNSKLKNHPISLTAAAEEAFYTLKKKCVMAPVLAFADLKRPFLLETDASKYSLGTVLQQVQEDGKYHPVVYASHTLHGSEANYHSSKLEFLALKWAMTQQFKEYLMYQPFTMWTDNTPLMYVLRHQTWMPPDTIGFQPWLGSTSDWSTYAALTTELPMYWAGWKLDWMITPPMSSYSPWMSHPMMPRTSVMMPGKKMHGHWPRLRRMP